MYSVQQTPTFSTLSFLKLVTCTNQYYLSLVDMELAFPKWRYTVFLNGQRNNNLIY